LSLRKLTLDDLSWAIFSFLKFRRALGGVFEFELILALRRDLWWGFLAFYEALELHFRAVLTG
jgi:hypothetical protein